LLENSFSERLCSCGMKDRDWWFVSLCKERYRPTVVKYSVYRVEFWDVL